MLGGTPPAQRSKRVVYEPGEGAKKRCRAKDLRETLEQGLQEMPGKHRITAQTQCSTTGYDRDHWARSIPAPAKKPKESTRSSQQQGCLPEPRPLGGHLRPAPQSRPGPVASRDHGQLLEQLSMQQVGIPALPGSDGPRHPRKKRTGSGLPCPGGLRHEGLDSDALRAAHLRGVQVGRLHTRIGGRSCETSSRVSCR